MATTETRRPTAVPDPDTLTNAHDAPQTLAGAKEGPPATLDTTKAHGANRAQERHIQAALDEIVWFHGRDPLCWSTVVYHGLLARGIKVEHITAARLALAQQRSDAVRAQRLRLAPPNQDIATEWPGSSQATDAAKREKLRQKLQLVRDARKRSHDNDTSSSTGVLHLPTLNQETSMATVVKVREGDFRAALVAMGFHADTDPNKWDLKRLNKKVASAEEFTKLVDAAKKSPEGDALTLIQNIADALRDGDGVEVLSDSNHEGNGHADDAQQTKKTPKKKEKDMTATTKSTKATKGTKATKNDKSASRGPSLLDAAATVLKGSKRPMKIGAIFDKIMEKGLWQSKKGATPKATLAAAIYVEIKNKGDESRFQKADRGEFVYNG